MKPAASIALSAMFALVASLWVIDVGAGADAVSPARQPAAGADTGGPRHHCATGQLRAEFEPLVALHISGKPMRSRVGGLVETDHVMVCGNQRLESLPDTLHAYALEGYGALQVGQQRICGRDQPQCNGEAVSFLAVWRVQEGQWRIVQLVRFG